MAVLTLNGIAVPAALDEVSRLAPELIGEEGRAFSGADLTNVRAYKEGWRAKLTPQTATAGAAFRGLALGLGYSWSFDTAAGLYADRKGLGPSLSTGCAVGAGGKYGERVKVNGGSRLGYAISGSATKWTCLFWKKSQATGTWEHFIVQGDGTKHKNGATTAEEPLVSYDGTTLYFLSPGYFYATLNGAGIWTATTGYAVDDHVMSTNLATLLKLTSEGSTSTSGGSEPAWNTAYGATTTDNTMTWTSQGEAAGYFDDALFWPFLLPSTWPAQLYAEANARAWTPLPRLRLAGDAAAELASGFATVTGKLSGDAKLVRAVLSGSLARNADPIEMEFREA